MRYDVILTRDTTESATVTVEAESQEKAEALALEQVETALFTTDDNIPDTAYITGCTAADDGLHEAADGDICTACERDSLDCSANPCDDVLEDRGEVSRWIVTLRADGIDVTGRPSEVERFARSDALEFAGQWDYSDCVIQEAQQGEELTDCIAGPGPSVDLTETSRFHGVSRFSAEITVVVLASSEGTARAAAIALFN